MRKIEKSRHSRKSIPSKLILLLNNAGSKWKRGEKEKAVEMIRKAYEMTQEYSEDVRYGAILRIIDSLISFNMLNKASEIAEETFKEIKGENVESILEKVNLLVRIGRIKEMRNADASNVIDKAFSLLEEKKNEFPSEYISFSNAILIPFLQEQGEQKQALKKLKSIVNFAKTIEEKSKRIELLLAESITTLADLEATMQKEKSTTHYNEAYNIYNKYEGFTDQKGEIIVNQSDTYLQEGKPKQAIEVIKRIKDEIENKRIRIPLLENEAQAFSLLGKDEKAEKIRSELDQIRANVQKRMGR